MTDPLIAGLNERQRAAVTAGPGPILVLAGPGSGKTRVLTRRIAYLTQAMNVRPYHIMAVTFTNKAAGEMRQRLKDLIGEQVRGLQIGTFHATCARILRMEHHATPYEQDFVIYDTDDQLSAVAQAMQELSVDTRKFNPRAVLNAISGAKNELILPAQYVAGDYFGEIVSRVYPRYQMILVNSNALDFDDLLMQMVVALRDNDVLRDKYQHKFQWVLVDEFQDTNTAQYQLVRLLGAPQDNVFVVGDEDQSIYAFRGADYRNVMRFRQDYPDASVYLLEQNYRSTQVVLDVANAIISRNRHRTPKKLFTQHSGGDLVTIHEAYDEQYEAEYVIDQIEALLRRGYTYNDMAVMYRTNPQSRALERACVQAGVPHTIIGGVGFYKRREVKDLLAYLRLVHNPDDRAAFTRVVNTPKRGIGNKTVDQFHAWAAESELRPIEAFQHLIDGLATELNARAAKVLRDFAEKLWEWRSLAGLGKLATLYDAIVSDIGYRLYVREISESDREAQERLEYVDQLRGLVAEADADERPLGDFLAEQALMTDADTLTESGDRVTLMTLHAAKGLEFPVVFLVGLEDGLLPHMRSLEEPDGVEEERRLLYVGVTRAKQRLFLSYAFRRTLYGGSEQRSFSPFLSDVPPELVDGLPTALSGQSDYQSYKTMTTWERPDQTSAAGLGRLARDLKRGSASREDGGNSSLRGKIIRFPGAQSSDEEAPASQAQGRYQPGMRVSHAVFGEGTVIESRMNVDDEEVTVAFLDRRHGIKMLLASLANLDVL